MIEIEEPPEIRACATCPAILSWLWSPKTRAWICVIPIDATTFRLHECRHAQAPGTWRALAAVPDPGQADINAAGRAAVAAALAAKDQTRTDKKEQR